MKPLPLKGDKWLEALASGGTRIALELGGYHSRFTPAPGWDTGPRNIAEHLVYFVTEGRCTVVAEGRRTRAAAGSLCWVCPGTPFRFFVGPRDTVATIHRFRFRVDGAAGPLRPEWRYRVVPDIWPSLDAVRQIILEAERPGRFGDWRVRSLLSLLSIAVLKASPSRRGPVLHDAQRAEIAAFLSRDAAARPTPADLARHLGFSATYFARVFRRTYGVSPRAWIVQQRLRHASVLLRESTSRVSEIASLLGYPDVYVLSRQFRAMFGVGPRQWRKDAP